MEKEQWRKKYIERLMEKGGLSESEATEEYEGGLDDHDYEDDPVYAADENMSYWAE